MSTHDSTQPGAIGSTETESDIFSERTHLKPYEYSDFLDYVDAIRNSYWVHDEFADFGGTDEPLPDGRVRRSDSTTAVLGVSTRSNPANPDDYIARQERQRSGEAYEQEIEGEFVSFEGLVHKWFGRDNRVASDELPDTWDQTIYGVDWGGSAPTAIVCLRQSGDDWYIIAEFYQRRVVNDTIIAELERLFNTHGHGPIYCDTNEPRAIEQLRREEFPAREADKAVETGIRYVSSLQDRLYVSENCQSVIDEFNQYRYKDGGNSDTVLKENDHAMDALRYALFTHSPRESAASNDNDTGIEERGNETDRPVSTATPRSAASDRKPAASAGHARARR